MNIKQRDRRFTLTADVKNGKTLELSVYHTKGGWNYFHGGKENSKYQLSVAVGETSSNGMCFSYTPFDDCNYRIGIMDADRFNAKKLKQLADLILTSETVSLYDDKSAMFNHIKKLLNEKTA